MKLIVSALITLFLAASFGQTTIEGTITSDDGPVGYAEVKIMNPSDSSIVQGTYADDQGHYSIDVKNGSYLLNIAFFGYTAKYYAVDAKGMLITQDVNLSTSAELEVVEIVFEESKEVANDVGAGAAIQGDKEEDGTVKTISVAEAESKGSSDVGEAISQESGMSTQGATIYVRGLGDRYNAAYINGLPLPSPDPDLKVMPMDLFPLSVIRTISVSKSYNPAFYGDATGGSVNINTLLPYNKPTYIVSLSAGMNSQSTGRDFMTYEGGKTDWLGYDDGTRALPQQFEGGEGYISQEGQTSGFDETKWNPLFQNALPNYSFSLQGGQFFSFGDSTNSKNKLDDKGIGFVFHLSQGNSTEKQFGSYAVVNAQGSETRSFETSKDIKKTKLTGLASIQYNINKNNDIRYNMMYLNVSQDYTSEIYGKHIDYTDSIYSRRFDFEQNSVLLNQLMGRHTFNPNLTFHWSGEYGITKSYVPDRRELSYFYTDRNADTYFSNVRDQYANYRFYSNLDETEIAGDLHLEQTLKKEGDTTLMKITYGGAIRMKNRDFNYSQYNYILTKISDTVGPNQDPYNPEFIINDENHVDGLYTVRQQATFPYGASLNIYSGYGVFSHTPNKRLNYTVGLRYEYSNQQTSFTNDLNRPQFVIIDEPLGIFPSITAKINLDKNPTYDVDATRNFLKLNASRTITRPGFREVASFEYIEFFGGMPTVGNPYLQNAYNYNFDARYEFYPTFGQTIAVGAFGKYLDNPIESSMEVTSSLARQTYQNAEAGYIAGVEVEFRRSLDFLIVNKKISKDSLMLKRASSELRNLTFAFNAAYIYSRVILDTTSTSFAPTNYTRPLQGASPWLINASLGYNKVFYFSEEDGEDKLGKEKFSFNLTAAYGVFGRRLYSVGVQGIGDQYQMPTHTLNFTGGVTFRGKISLGIAVGNILNARYYVLQEASVLNGQVIENSAKVVNSYRKGIDASISVAYKFGG